MKKIFYILVIVAFACNTSKKYLPAEDALDAAREYKEACLKGDFEKAKFYAVPNEKSKATIEQLEKIYNKTVDSKARKESKEASIIIKANNTISKDTFQIITTNTFDKKMDTLTVVYQNSLWQVNL